MLWDIIRDFFVTYIFGGNASSGLFYTGFFGQFFCVDSSGSQVDTLNTATLDTYVKLDNFLISDFDANTYLYICVGDWLSTTFTIITLILICYMFLRITIWLFKFGAGLFKW